MPPDLSTMGRTYKSYEAPGTRPPPPPNISWSVRHWSVLDGDCPTQICLHYLEIIEIFNLPIMLVLALSHVALTRKSNFHLRLLTFGWNNAHASCFTKHLKIVGNGRELPSRCYGSTSVPRALLQGYSLAHTFSTNTVVYLYFKDHCYLLYINRI